MMATEVGGAWYSIPACQLASLPSYDIQTKYIQKYSAK
jgi:hypothetical protein